LGSVDVFPLAEARIRALEARHSVKSGIDPLAAKQAAALAATIDAAKGVTFRQCAEKYIAAHSPSWKSAVHRKQWSSTLETYAYPQMGELPVSEINTAIVMKAVEPIWSSKPDTAGRLRGRIEAILDWAAVREFRAKENPARWKGHLDKLLPARAKIKRVRHHPALPYVEIGAFMGELRVKPGISPRALEFAILTCCRTIEVIGCEWNEFDFAERVWTIPGERMKHGRLHRVPLTDRELEILVNIPREGKFVFPGAKKDTHLSNMAMLELLKNMRPGLTVHGFRSTFRDWCGERTNYPNHVAEMALAHTIADETEAAYRRGDLMEKRRRLAREWERFCNTPSATPSNVIELHGGGETA
jgi:integrase